MITSLELTNFRLFNGQRIILGQRITVLAGRNSTGKSTILGLLGNSGEIKKKDGQPLVGGQFRTEFSEIFKGSAVFDPKGPHRCIVRRTNDDDVDFRDFRVAWQNEGPAGNRFRIIPERYDDIVKTSAKMKFPVLYLGLSRLYPLGEATQSRIETNTFNFPNVEYKTWFIEKYQHILSLHETISDVSSSKLGETENKRAIGVNTERYDYLANSAGQDNVGQVLLAILSFRQVHEKNPELKDGLLLLDELDATLHPAAQNKLFDVLQRSANDYGFQVAFTTHSMSLLKHVCGKVKSNNNAQDTQNPIELYYFTNANRTLDLRRNVDYLFIESDLLIQTAIDRRIRVYAEDDEARWFFKNLIGELNSRIDLVESYLGCDNLLTLLKCDPTYFQTVLIVLDGDVKGDDGNIKPNKLSKIPLPLRSRLSNIICLPELVRPEDVFYNYLISLPHDHAYWRDAEPWCITWDAIRENGPNSPQYQNRGAERDRAKAWFQDYLEAFESSHLFTHWKNDNDPSVQEFVLKFIQAYNSVADKQGMTKITRN